MDHPIVSVIVASKNRKEMLRQLLESFAALTYPRDRFEVLLVDDGSTGGPAAPRNLGIQASRGEFLAFTDSDCVVLPQWLSAAVPCFGPGIGLVKGKALPHPADPKALFSTSNTILAVNGDSCNILYTREAIEKTGGGFSANFIDGWPHPFLVRRHPSSRKELLFLRCFVDPMTALYDLASASVFLAVLLHQAWLVLSLPFFVGKYVESSSRNPVFRLLRVAGLDGLQHHVRGAALRKYPVANGCSVMAWRSSRCLP